VLLGDTANAAAADLGKPLDGIRVLALEQMQALPYATQLLSRLGADVVKIESPHGGDLGRGSLPAMTDPEGRRIGATFLRNNFNKRSMCIDLRQSEGRELALQLAKKFDVVAENSKAGSMAKLGLSYEDVAAVHPEVIYLSVSGFGNRATELGESPYRSWPAFAPVVEAMSGIYEIKRVGDNPPTPAPVGALGDIGAALFATIGVLTALRQRDRTGKGSYVDIAMMDALVAMTDIVSNFWSLGLKGGAAAPLIMHGFRAKDGWFIIQAGREAQFNALVSLVGHPEWSTDERFATRQGWLEHMEDTLRPAIEAWAASRDKIAVCEELGRAGIAAGPCFSDEELVHDEHVRIRNMLVEMPRTDGEAQPVLVPGNPVKISTVADGPDTRVPWLGEHTDEVLGDELGLDKAAIADLRERGIVS
jgi:crotonobetainyl-CoA:carnitine CoA-transferase CaiB-like acyl-CoA transferase